MHIDAQLEDERSPSHQPQNSSKRKKSQEAWDFSIYEVFKLRTYSAGSATLSKPNSNWPKLPASTVYAPVNPNSPIHAPAAGSE